MSKPKPPKQIHFNQKQLELFALRTNNTEAFWARGTGKTEGVIAPASLSNVLEMPRANGMIAERSYVTLLKFTLPALKKTWEKFGYIENQHYWIGKQPPKHFNIPKAYRSPSSNEHYIQFFNGSGIFLAGMDRPSTMNGGSNDWQIYDELRLLKEDAVKEAILTCRDNKAIFGKMWQHNSILKVSDMPKTKSQSWILDNTKTMDTENMDMILKLHLKIEDLRSRMKKSDEGSVNFFNREIRYLYKYLNQLKKENYFVSYASTIDNIHVLGVDTIKNFKRQLTAIEYQRSVLNKPILNADGGFYPTFDEDIHTYEAVDYNYIDKLELHKPGVENNCLSDIDLDHTQPIQIGCDVGANINLIIVGQKNAKGNIKVLKYFYVTHPELTKDVVRKLCDYYSPYKLKQVIFHYDHTMVGRSGVSSNTYADEIVEAFAKHQWSVHQNYIGQQPGHDYRYRLFNKIFGSGGDKIPRVTINRTNCTKLIYALQGAELKTGRNGFEKNKTDERNLRLDQSETTHATDGLDTLVVGMMGNIHTNGYIV